MQETALKLKTMEASDVPGLEAIGHRGAGLFTHRLGEQERNISLTIVAYVGEFPVGHAVVTWEGAENVRSFGITCPDVSDVWVKETWRRRGIGTILVQACEAIVRGQNFNQIGLAVGVSNEGAQSLYEKAGYTKVDAPDFMESGEWTDKKGRVHRWGELCQYRVKALAP